MNKQQFGVLYRQFLFRMVDLEVLSSHAQGDANKLLGRFAALLVFFSVWLALAALLFGGSRLTPIAAFAAILVTEHFLIATTMLVVGLFAVLSWDATFPNRRDVMVLAPLPVRPQTMFLAKVAAVGTALALTVLLLHGAMGLIWPGAFARQAEPVTVPALTFDPTPTPVPAGNLKTVLDGDLREILTHGALAPGTGAGLAVGVFKHGEARVFSYGAAKPDALFEIGSITKTFTALMLAQMVVQRQVALEEPIRLLLPPDIIVQPKSVEITLADLATQHAELPSTVAGEWREYLARRGVGRMAHTRFLYSNFGFGLLGELLAEHAGIPYAELLKQQITDPLGLNDTMVSLSPEQHSRVMQGYDGAQHPVPEDAVGLAGSGAIRSTAGDMLKYLEANLHPEKLGGTLPQALALAHRPRAEGPPGTAIALAWWYTPSKKTWGHGGAMRGFTSNAYFHPEGDDAAVVLFNHGPEVTGLADTLIEHIRQRLAGEPAISLNAVDVSAASGIRGVLRWYGAYWFTMLAASGFMYCCILGVQGLAAQLPRQLFLKVSGVLQMAAFCLVVCGYFLQPGFGGLDDLSGPQIWRLMRWLPSYWFLGLFHELNGSTYPALAPLAQRAWAGLAIAVGGTGLAYTLSYIRTLRKIVEEPDIMPGSRSFGWLPPFGNRVQTAIGQFAVRTLVRSRQHRLITAFYLGVGLALTIFLNKAQEVTPQVADALAGKPWREANTPVLGASIVMLIFGVIGTRVVFAMPLDLRANWVFRITGVRPVLTLDAVRRALLLLSAAPVLLVSGVLCLWLWPWWQAAGHLVALGFLGTILASICLRGFRKIPFTCSYLPGKSHVHMVFLGAIGVMWFVILGVKYEREVLQEPGSILTMLLVLGLLAAAARWSTAPARSPEEDLRFEELQTPAIQQLGLQRDGVMPISLPREHPPIS